MFRSSGQCNMSVFNKMVHFSPNVFYSATMAAPAMADKTSAMWEPKFNLEESAPEKVVAGLAPDDVPAGVVLEATAPEEVLELVLEVVTITPKDDVEVGEPVVDEVFEVPLDNPVGNTDVGNLEVEL